jgi:hypothetical protein
MSDLSSRLDSIELAIKSLADRVYMPFEEERDDHGRWIAAGGGEADKVEAHAQMLRDIGEKHVAADREQAAKSGMPVTTDMTNPRVRMNANLGLAAAKVSNAAPHAMAATHGGPADQAQQHLAAARAYGEGLQATRDIEADASKNMDHGMSDDLHNAGDTLQSAMMSHLAAADKAMRS